MKRRAKRTREKKLQTIIPEELVPQLDVLREIVLDKSGVHMEQLSGKLKNRTLVDTRRVFVSMATRYCRFTVTETHRPPYKRKPTLQQLGKYLGDRDHSSIHSLLKNVDNLLKYDKTFDKLHTAIELEYTKLFITPQYV